MENIAKYGVWEEEASPYSSNDADSTSLSAQEVGVQEERSGREHAHRLLTRFVLVTLISIVAAWTIVVVMLTNMTSAFGDIISIITAFEFLLSIFSIHYGIIYITLAKFAFSILYIIFLILAIKNVISITYDCLKTFSHKVSQYAYHRPEGVSPDLYGRTASILTRFCILLIAAYVLSGDPLTVGSWIGVVVVGLYTLLVYCLVSFPHGAGGNVFRSKEMWVGYGLKIVQKILSLVCVCYLAFFLAAPAGYDLAFGIQVLFGGFFHSVGSFFQTFYSAVGDNILKIAALFILISQIKTVLTEHITVSHHIVCLNDRNMMYANKRMQKACLYILIVLLIIAACTCVSSVIGESGRAYVREGALLGWWNLIKDTIFPAVLASVAGIVITTYMKEKPQRR